MENVTADELNKIEQEFRNEFEKNYIEGKFIGEVCNITIIYMLTPHFTQTKLQPFHDIFKWENKLLIHNIGLFCSCQRM
jgi:hypothetical protein